MSVKNSIFSYLKLDIWKMIALVVLAVTGLFFFFYNAFRFEMPLGFSGMYTLMAEQISDNHYKLPEIIPFYGPGGVPFAYPPLGFYVMALVKDMFDISSMVYLRFMPPLFSLFALLPLFLLVQRKTSSFWSAYFSVFFLLFSPTLYYNHIWAAGMVRGLAFMLMLCGIYFFYLALEKKEKIYIAFSGIFLGLTILSHLFYGLFFALWVAFGGLAEFTRKAWRTTLFTAFIGSLVSVPWIALMINRYGFSTFSHAFSSHDNSAFIDVFVQGVPTILIWLVGKFFGVPIPLFAFVLAGFAVLYLLYKRQFGIPVILLAMVLILSPEGDRFLVLIVSILLGISFSAILEVWDVRWAQIVVGSLIFISIFQMGNYGIRDVFGSAPVLYSSAYDVADFVKENVPENSRYLFIAGQAEAEWLPYILKREPFVSKWGSEWLGTYEEQRILQGRVAFCKDSQSLQCLKELGLNVRDGDIILTKKSQKRLSLELEESGSCSEIDSFGIYVLWRANCLIP